MGWKLGMLILDPAPKMEYDKFVRILGYNGKKLEKSTKLDFEYQASIYHLNIGVYQNKLVITSGDLPYKFYTEKPDSLELELIKNFPNTRFYACSLGSATNSWGYCILEPKDKIRRIRMGSADMGVILDIGKQLEEENIFFNNSYINDNGERMYKIKGHSENYSEDQVGENFVFELFKRFFGVDFFEIDGFGETEMITFEIKENN